MMAAQDIETIYFDESSQEEYTMQPTRTKKSRKAAKKQKKCLRDSPLGASGHFEVFSSITISPDKVILTDTKELLLSLSMSQKDLADQLGVSQTKISQYLNGGSRMRGWKGMEDALQHWVTAKQTVASEVSSPCSSSDSPHSSADESSDTQSSVSDSDLAPQDLESTSFCEPDSVEFNYFEPLPSSFNYINNNDYSHEDSWSSFSIMAIYGEAVGN